MIIQTNLNKPRLLRQDSCSSAEIKKQAVLETNKLNSVETRVPKNLSVTFKNDVYVKTIEHLNDSPVEEIEATWYNRSEYATMRAERETIARMIETGMYKGDDDNICARGLEAKSRSGAARRRMHKLSALLAVLDEQELQREENARDHVALASVYLHASFHSKYDAQQMAELDAKEAFRIHNGEESLTKVFFGLELEGIEEIGDASCSSRRRHISKRLGKLIRSRTAATG